MAKLFVVGNLKKVIVNDDGVNMNGNYRGEQEDLTLALILYRIIDGMSRVQGFMGPDDKDIALGIWQDLRECLDEGEDSHEFTEAEVDLLKKSCKASMTIGLNELNQLIEELDLAKTMTDRKKKPTKKKKEENGDGFSADIQEG